MPEHPKHKKKKKLTRQEWKERYGSDTSYFADFLNKIETSSNKSIRTIILEEAKAVGVDPNFLYSTLMAEGLDDYLVRQSDFVEKEFPVDGFMHLGLDTIGNVKEQLFKKGYLNRKEYGEQTKERREVNEKIEEVQTARFRNLNYGVKATAAFIRNSNDFL